MPCTPAGPGAWAEPSYPCLTTTTTELQPVLPPVPWELILVAGQALVAVGKESLQ